MEEKSYSDSIEKGWRKSHMRHCPFAPAFQPSPSLVSALFLLGFQLPSPLFFCFAPFIYLPTYSRPKASRKIHSNPEPLLFVVRWSKTKAQVHIWVHESKPMFLPFLFLAPSRVSKPLLFILYSLFFISAFYFFHFTSHVDTRWLHYLIIKCFLGTFTTSDWVVGHFLFFIFLVFLFNSCLARCKLASFNWLAPLWM